MSLTLAQLIQVLANTNANLQTLMVAATPRTPSSLKKTAAPPDDYGGDIEKCEAFLQSLFLYFHGKNFTDEKKITMMLSYLKGGNAEEWRNQHAQQIADREYVLAFNAQANLPQNQQIAILVAPFNDFNDFILRFKTRFGDHNPAETAQLKLETIEMGSNFAEVYVQDFHKYENISGHNDLTLLGLFCQGLAKRVRSRINGMDNVPTTLRLWQDKAVQFDRQWHTEQAQERDARNYRQAHTGLQGGSSNMP